MEAWVLIIHIVGKKGFFWDDEPKLMTQEFTSEAACLAGKQATFEQLRVRIDPWYIRLSCVKK